MLPALPTANAAHSPAVTRDCRCIRARHAHGTRGAYNRDGCRCSRCVAANADAARAYRLRTAQHGWNRTSPWCPPLGTIRRLRALSATGWSTRELAARLGVTSNAVANLRSTTQTRILASTAAAITALYEDTWWRTPTNRQDARVERCAEANGWAAPWQWENLDLDDPHAEPLPALPSLGDIDEVAVAEAMTARPVVTTRAERRAAIDEMTRAGASAAEIAARIGTNERAVTRQRHRARAAAAAGAAAA